MLKASSILPAFSHIYIEKCVLDHYRTKKVLASFPKAQPIEIECVSEITGHKGSSWGFQKMAPKLVLAYKASQLIYPCSDVAPNFGHEHFYYAVPMQNCLYDCEYCYLQGMYNSAHLVLFVNQEEMQQAVRVKAREVKDLYLCIAYDNDLMALEGRFGLVREWAEALRLTPEVTIEVRTKSASFSALKGLAPASNVILAWTLSPIEMATRFELKAPPLEARIKSLLAAIKAGWRVRVCLDPLLPLSNWQEIYKNFLITLDASLPWDKLEDASYGTFRMNSDYLRQARKARPDSTLLQSATARDQRGLHILPQHELLELLDWVGSSLKQRLGSKRVFVT